MIMGGIQPLVLVLLLSLPVIIMTGFILYNPVVGLVIICLLLPLETLIGMIHFPLFPIMGAIIVAGYLINTSLPNIYSNVPEKDIYIDYLIFLLFVGWIVLRNPYDAWDYPATSGERYSLTLMYIQLAIVYYLSSQLLRNNYLSWIALALMIGTTLSVIYELVTVGFGLDLFMGDFRLIGAFGDPNGLATFALCNLAFLPATKNLFKNNWISYLINVLGFFQIFILFLTKSKTVLLALGFLMLLWLFAARSNSFIKRIIIIVTSIIILSAFIIPAHHWTFMYNTITGDIIHQEGSFGSRYTYWQAAYLAFKTAPIWGIGGGQFPWYTYKYSFIGGRDLGTVVHNAYISILTEEGIIGLSLFLGWIFLAAYRFWEVFKRGTNEDLRVKGFSGFCAFAMILFMSLTLSHEYSKILWIMAGSSIALTKEKAIMQNHLNKLICINQLNRDHCHISPPSP
jgi:O-antigen ligase